MEPLFYRGLNKKNKNDFCNDLKCKIPYLNVNSNQDSSWKDNFLNIPNSLFSNENKNGILDVFDLYNFTVDESTDFDVELAVDPEMLGYIFENLLPENLKKSRAHTTHQKKLLNIFAKKVLANI